MKHFIICCVLLVCLLVTSDAGRRRRRRRNRGRWEGSINGGYSQDRGWHITAGVKFKFGKKRSAGLGLMETSNCVPTLPCKFETYDTNEDGEITLDEFEKKLVQIGFEDRQYSIFTALDDDDDGKITQKEFDLVTPDLANGILFPECVKRT
ncbi:hypothetical protein KUTeg_005202 [Tegillarca granosa]|uniref:EF-hand domain-containing protein n=1 Tax=Tegillarca granosa TaxID=220873 RepID=A0ABQ9FJ08_TEGGR|nr:hypothetical protein KUTeg_005202 [Tegillarca granosa]